MACAVIDLIFYDNLSERQLISPCFKRFVVTSNFYFELSAAHHRLIKYKIKADTQYNTQLTNLSKVSIEMKERSEAEECYFRLEIR